MSCDVNCDVTFVCVFVKPVPYVVVQMKYLNSIFTPQYVLASFSSGMRLFDNMT